MALAATLYQMDADERRMAPRQRVGRETMLRQSDAAVLIVLHDLSSAGAMIETHAPLELGATVTIGLPGVGRFAAEVVNRSGDRYGCRFAEPLPSGTVERAFQVDPIVVGPFAPRPESGNIDNFAAAPTDPIPDHKWPGVVRIALPVGFSLAAWAVILHFL